MAISDFSQTEQELATHLYGALVKLVDQPHHQVQGIQSTPSNLYIPVEFQGFRFHVQLVRQYD